VHLPTEDTRTRCLWLEQFQIAEYLSSGLGGRCLCQGRRCPRSARRRFPVIDIWPGPKPDGYRAIPCQFHAVLCSASRHVCGAVPAACSHARVEVIAVALIHARIAARSGDGTAHTVSTGCGIIDRGLHSGRNTRRKGVPASLAGGRSRTPSLRPAARPLFRPASADETSRAAVAALMP